MRATGAYLSKGFWGRSIDEFKRLSNISTEIPFVASVPCDLNSIRHVLTPTSQPLNWRVSKVPPALSRCTAFTAVTR